ncbi:lipoprotein signal peptidase [Rapidithrix thailandica]|uniref:Lipoprotein signal peptidase n=1 Tax=Rapidithrix thailandica TaxID=413964 RepID=A0AAW9S6S0_9BACT
MKYLKFYLLAIGIICLDQVVKLVIHNTMELGEEIPIFGNWFKLHYTLNEGMAFGIKFGSEYGKLALTLFRVVAMFGIGYYIYLLVKKQVHTGFVWCVTMILGGAVGNVIDSTFYGVMLDNAPVVENHPLFYPWFHGQVIDMFYFDIWQGYLPEWLGGGYYSLWPIFNIADASIFVGVAFILIFQKRFFPDEKNKNAGNADAGTSDETSEVEVSKINQQS